MPIPTLQIGNLIIHPNISLAIPAQPAYIPIVGWSTAMDYRNATAERTKEINRAIARLVANVPANAPAMAVPLTDTTGLVIGHVVVNPLDMTD
jgi:hypothetical protein